MTDLIAVIRRTIEVCCPPVTAQTPLPLEFQPLMDYVNAAPALLDELETLTALATTVGSLLTRITELETRVEELQYDRDLT